jgi:hypothetical protein
LLASGCQGVESIKAATGAKGKQSRGTPPLDAIQKHLGADAAIWDFLKEGSESAAVEAKVLPEQRPAASVVVPGTDNLGFVASQAGVRALAASQLLPAPGNGTPVRLARTMPLYSDCPCHPRGKKPAGTGKPLFFRRSKVTSLDNLGRRMRSALNGSGNPSP